MFEPEDEPMPMPEGGGDEPMMKEAKSGALHEILDLLTRMEMEQHGPKPPAAPGGPPEMGGEAPPVEGGGEGALSPEDIEIIKAKLDTMA